MYVLLQTESFLDVCRSCDDAGAWSWLVGGEEERIVDQDWDWGGPARADLFWTFTNSNSEDSLEPPLPCGGAVWVDILLLC